MLATFSFPQRLARLLLLMASLAGLPLPAAPLPPEIVGAKPPEAPAVLRLAQDYHEKTRTLIEPAVLGEFLRVINWPVNFEGKNTDPKRAAELSLSVAVLVSNTKARNFYLASASAVFALDPKNANSAGNFAAAIMAYGEDAPGGIQISEADGSLKRCRNDAITVYQYALSLPAAGPAANEASAVPLLVNLGNLYIDSKLPQSAKAAFERALRLAPKSWPAHQGMAAYYLLVGRKDLAEKELQNRELWPAVRRHAAAEGEKTAEEKAPVVVETDSEESMEEKLARLRATTPTTMADFIGEIDQSEANRMRYFVEHLASEAVYHAPDLREITQYGTLEAISQPRPRAFVESWFRKWGLSDVKAFAQQAAARQVDQLKALGVTLRGGGDLQDLIDHPEKYKGGKNRKHGKGQEGLVDTSALKAKVAEMKALTERAKKENRADQARTLSQAIGVMHGGSSILTANPYNYANPADVFIQKYNMILLYRKKTAYELYLFKVTDRILQDIADIRKVETAEATALTATIAEELEKVKARAKEEGWGYEKEMLQRHKVHEAYYSQINAISSSAWAQTATIANSQYLRKLKPNLEAMYSDCIRHLLLISDPDVRTTEESGLMTSFTNLETRILNIVAQGYGGSYLEPWSCDCDIDALVAARAAEAAEFEAAQAEQRAKNLKGKDDFYKKVIPDTSALYKRMDQYSATYQLLFIEFKVGVFRSEVAVKLDTPNPKGGPTAGFNLKVVMDDLSNQVTVKGGIEASEKAESKDGRLSISGKVYTEGFITLDGTSLAVQDWDVAAGATLSGSVGTGERVGGAASVEGTVTYEASVMRGNSLSADLDVIMAPANQVAKDLESGFKDNHLSGFSRDRTVKRSLWSGKYQFE